MKKDAKDQPSNKDKNFVFMRNENLSKRNRIINFLFSSLKKYENVRYCPHNLKMESSRE